MPFRKSFFHAMMAIVIAGGSTASAQDRYGAITNQIIDAWKTADVVCLGEDHNRFYANELRIALIRHPAFPRTVRVVVLEMANPVHQDLLDKFILDGAAMSRDEIAPVWRDATNPEVWESPIYEQLLRAVRDVNLKLTRDQRVRVIGGDGKVDWSKIDRPEDLIPLMNRGKNIREIIASEVLDNHLKALAIYGGGHCIKVGMGFPGDLRGRYPPERFWSISSLGREREVQLGRTTFGLGSDPAYIVLTGTRWAATPAIPQSSGRTFSQLLDAVVYHGNVSDSVIGPDMATFKARMGQELDRRAKLLSAAIKLSQSR